MELVLIFCRSLFAAVGLDESPQKSLILRLINITWKCVSCRLITKVSGAIDKTGGCLYIVGPCFPVPDHRSCWSDYEWYNWSFKAWLTSRSIKRVAETNAASNRSRTSFAFGKSLFLYTHVYIPFTFRSLVGLQVYW